MKKIILIMLVILTAVGIFTACKKNKAEVSTEKGGIILTAEDYNSVISAEFEKHGSFSLDKLKEKDVEYVVLGESYTYLTYIPKAKVGYLKVLSNIDITVEKIFAANNEKDEISVNASDDEENGYKLSNSSYKKDTLVDTTQNQTGRESGYYIVVNFTVGSEVKSAFSIEITTMPKQYVFGENETLKCQKELRYKKQAKAEASIKFLTAEEYAGGNIDERLKDTVEVGAGEKFYAVIDYTFSEYGYTEELDTASVVLTVSLGMEPEVEAFPTSAYTKDGNTVNASLKFYSTGESTKSFRFVLSVSSHINYGEMEISASVTGEKISFFGEKNTAAAVFTVNKAVESESLLEYELSGDGSYYILTGLGSEKGDKITVPEKYKNVPVKEIADNVFSYITYIKEIKLSAGLEKIGASAFKNCTGIKSIVIPSTVTSMGADAFGGCTMEIFSETEAYPDGWSYSWNPEYLTVNWKCNEPQFTYNSGSNTYTFSYAGANNKEVVIPDTYNGVAVTVIGENAFCHSSDVVSITVPNSILAIRQRAFENCTEIESIVIPNSVTVIEEGVFSGCSALKSITIPFVGNGKQSTVGVFCEFGYIFGTTDYIGGAKISSYNATSYVYCIPAALRSVTVTGGKLSKGAFFDCSMLTEINLPEGITEIDEAAFKNCTALKSIVIPSTVQTVGESAFENCTKIKSVVIPAAVTKINEYAFNGCVSLTDIKFENSDKTWWQGEEAYTNVFVSKEMDITDPTANAENFVKLYPEHYWYKK